MIGGTLFNQFVSGLRLSVSCTTGRASVLCDRSSIAMRTGQVGERVRRQEGGQGVCQDSEGGHRPCGSAANLISRRRQALRDRDGRVGTCGAVGRGSRQQIIVLRSGCSRITLLPRALFRTCSSLTLYNDVFEQVLALAREGAKYGVFVVAAGAMLMVKKPDGK